MKFLIVGLCLCSLVNMELVASSLEPRRTNDEREWNRKGSGRWGNRNNWKPTAVPRTNGTAIFGDKIKKDTTIYATGWQRVYFIHFDSSHSYTLNNGDFLSGPEVYLTATNKADHTINSTMRVNRSPLTRLGFFIDKESQGSLYLRGRLLDDLNVAGVGVRLYNYSPNQIIYVSGHNSYRYRTYIKGRIRVGRNSAFGMDRPIRKRFHRYRSVNLDGDSSLELDNGIAIPNIINTNGNVLTLSRDLGAAAVDGNIQGDGSVVKTGVGGLYLRGNNTYSGGTTISSGAIYMTHANSLGKGDVAMLNGTTLFVPDKVTFRNVLYLTGGLSTLETSSGSASVLRDIKGSGSFRKGGSGELFLKGKKTYSGSTVIFNGTLKPEVPDAISNSSGVVLQNRANAIFDLNGFDQIILGLSGGGGRGGEVAIGSKTLTLNPINDQTFSGKLSGNGVFLKRGSGNLTLAGKNPFSGKTVVDNGTLTINGELDSSVKVSPSGILKGNGKINNSVTCLGTLSPGNSVGIFSINGDYTQAAGSTLLAEINSITSDKLNVKNDVFIKNKTNVKLRVEKGWLNSDKTYTLIESNSGTVNGKYSKLIVPYYLSSGELAYSDKLVEFLYKKKEKAFETVYDVYTTTEDKPVSPDDKYNYSEEGKVLDKIHDEEIAEFEDFFVNLENLTTSELLEAMEQLTPAQLEAQTIAQQNAFFALQRGLENRFNGFVEEMNFSPCDKESYGLNFWGNFTNTWQRQKELSTNSFLIGHDNNTVMGLVGTDKNVRDWIYLGAFIGGSLARTYWNHSQGKGDVSSFYFGGYSSLLWKEGSLNFSCIGGWNSYFAERNIKYTNVDLTAKNNHKGTQVLCHIDGGYNLNLNHIIFRPFNSSDILLQREDGFIEKESGVLGLQVGKRDPKVFRNELGFKTMCSFSLTRGSKCLGNLNLSWV